MQTLTSPVVACGFRSLVVPLLVVLAGCSGSDSVTVEGDVPIAYVKRPTSTLGSSTDAIRTGSGGDLYILDKSSPSAAEQNITSGYTQGRGDVSDPEVSYDGRKLLFAMKVPNQQDWGIYEYDIAAKTTRKIVCSAPRQGNDVDPAYLPDGRIVFASDRQADSEHLASYRYHDEYERETVTNLHVMDADGRNCRQITFNQSHDRNPTVRMNGEIMFSHWDHVGGRNEFSVFKINQDGSNLFTLYGSHSPGDSYLHPREMPDGRVITTVMALSGTRDGGSLEILDVEHYSDEDAPGENAGPNQLGEMKGQFQVTRLTATTDVTPEDQEAIRGRGLSRRLGRYSTPYPLWDGTGRVLVVWSPSQPTAGTDEIGRAIQVEGTPRYGIYMLDLNKAKMAMVLPPQDGYAYADPVAIQPRPLPAVRPAVLARDPSIPPQQGLLNVNTVYDTDRLGRMGSAVLAADNGEAIPTSNGRPNIGAMKQPGTPGYESRVARFFRITKAVPTPQGLSVQAIGETDFELQQIVGYGVIEPDGSLRAHVPANTPITITALDQHGRAFTPHTNWIQALDGERRFCRGCHSTRLTTTIAGSADLLNTPSAAAGSSNPPHPDPATASPASSSTATMAEARTATAVTAAGGGPGALKLKPNIDYSDFWTPLYNARSGTAVTSQGSIRVDYSGLTNPPTVKGPASCRTAGGLPNEAGWDVTQCSIAINYPDHIQPIWTRVCVSCHGSTNPEAGLDLSAEEEREFRRHRSYQQLMIDEPVLDANQNVRTEINRNGEIEIVRIGRSAPVAAGSARESRLIERLFEEPLRASAPAGTVRSYCDVTGRDAQSGAPIWGQSLTTSPAPCRDHRNMLTAAEKRVISEWIDLGGQYYNDVYDSSGSLRSNAAALNRTTFNCQIQPMLDTQCASCHAPFGSGGVENAQFNGRRYVLTGQGNGDFSATATMVTTFNPPSDSRLLQAIANAVHTGALGSGQTTAYSAFQSWIAGTLTCP